MNTSIIEARYHPDIAAARPGMALAAFGQPLGMLP